MGVIKNEKGRIVGFEADEVPEETSSEKIMHTGDKVLSKEEFSATYGDVNGVKSEPQQPEVKPKRKRATKAEMAEKALADKVKTYPIPEEGVSFESTNRVPVQMRHKAEPDELIFTGSEISKDNPITALAKTYAIPEEKKLAIISSMQQFFDKAAEWRKTIDGLVITSVEDKGKMKVAREARLALKNLRIDGEKTVKAERLAIKDLISPMLLEDEMWLRSLQILETTIKPLEADLKEKEEFAERLEKQAKEELKNQRLAEIKPYLITENGADHYNLGDMPEPEFQALVKTYKRLADERAAAAQKEAEAKEAKEQAAQKEIERLKKEAAENEAKQAQQQKLIADRLAMLPGVHFNGKEATYQGYVVASLASLLNLNETSFSIIAEAHQKKVAEDQQKAYDAKILRRYERLEEMGFEYDEVSSLYKFNENRAIPLDWVQTYSDDLFDKWIDGFNREQQKERKELEEKKEAELKVQQQKIMEDRYKIREKQLLDLGLTLENGLFMFEGDQMVSIGTVQGDPDDRFEVWYGRIKQEVEQRNNKATENATDKDRAAVLIIVIDKFISDLPELKMSSPAGKKIVAGTSILLGKIKKYVQDESVKL